MHVELNGDMKEVSGYLDRFDATSNGINIKKLAEMLRESKQADDEFKVIFTLFTLHSMLCPTGGVHICPSFLLSIKDVNTIRYRNWATFCFGRLMQGIMRYKQEKLGHIGGCLLYLQILYINSVAYWKVQRDSSMCPVGLWNAKEIKRFMKWLEKQEGIGTDKVALGEKIKGGERESGESSKVVIREAKKKQSGEKGRAWYADVVWLYSRIHHINQVTAEILEHITDLRMCKKMSVSSTGKTPMKEAAEMLVGLANSPPIEETRPCTHFTGFRVGPFVLTQPVSDVEMKLIEYMMNEDLDQGEIIVQTKMNWLSRIEMLSLYPKRWIHGAIISVVAETLSNNEMSKGDKMNHNWFLPTYFAQKVLHEKCDIESLDRMRDLFKHNLAFCEKIFVSINHGASHWYVVVLDIPGSSVLIWDPLPSDMRKNALVGDAKKILRPLDELLMVDIRPASGFGGLYFESFRVMQGTTGLSRQPNGYDCGLHVIRFMECHGNVRELDFKHDLDEARKNLAIQLVNAEGNMLKVNVMQSASQFSFAE
ncbi:uncharacterized protein LOC112498549 isoform X2 [Citrus sinensis]|uniref:uncharacterized protein LOC112498549 isoform X2 n=1 Tax=Citrus sinensis TaxID=2711 RepID=UPI002279D51A|nr:uncharacterized protein LOC112498549 isoform X2 [Citrus sinensis]